MEKEMVLTKELLEEMRTVDIKKVDPSNLVDIHNVIVHSDLPEKERMLDFIQQIKNPYCFLCHGMIIKIKFSGKKRLEECIKSAMFLEE